MMRFLSLVVLISGFAPISRAQSVDSYGGRNDIACTTTGWFHTEKLNGNHWWLCDPLGHGFQAFGAQNALQTIHGITDPANVNNRLKGWGFNTLWIGSALDDFPFAVDAVAFPAGDHTNPVKMPFVLGVSPGYYGMNQAGNCGAIPGSNPIKDLVMAYTPFYVGFKTSKGTADFYDTGITNWMSYDLTHSCDIFLALASSPYLNYWIGLAGDDTDQLYGFGPGPDFATIPPGHNQFNLGMMVATGAPIQTAGYAVTHRAGANFVYTDTLMHSKMEFRNEMATKYATIGALNTAWNTSSYYTTFDSSGTCVGAQPITCAASASADLVGTGDGSTLTFNTTLSHTTVSSCTIQVLVAGSAVGGDIGTKTPAQLDAGSFTTCDYTVAGNIWGPNLSGTINNSTGALSLTFAMGHAPANGAAITATYVANGYGIGTGLLDEDARNAHAWIGQDWVFNSTTNAAVLADLNTFYQNLVNKYLSDLRTQLHGVSAFQNIMFLGPDATITYATPSAAPVLKAAGANDDFILGGGIGIVMTRAEMDFVATNYGDKPYIDGFYSQANPDSPSASYPNANGLNLPQGSYNDNVTRGLYYYNMQLAHAYTALTSAGNFPYIGSVWFKYSNDELCPTPQSSGGNAAYGLVTCEDNAMDGHEASVGAVACSSPIQAYTCGSQDYTCQHDTMANCNWQGNWTATTGYTNAKVEDSNGYVQSESGACTSGSGPTWSTVYGNITTDGTCTWTNQGGLRPFGNLIGVSRASGGQGVLAGNQIWLIANPFVPGRQPRL